MNTMTIEVGDIKLTFPLTSLREVVKAWTAPLPVVKYAGPMVPLLQRIADMGFSVRINNCLKNEGINYVGELVQKTERDLIAINNLGMKSIREIKVALASMGLTLGMPLPEWTVENVKELAA